MSIGALAIRGIVGPLFFGHGTQKLFGWFGGDGPEGTAGFFEGALGLRPGKRHALLAGAGEATAAVSLTLGALTPVGAAALTGAMTTAIRKVHAPNGPWVSDQGWEYNAVLIAAAAVLADIGPGSPSVDAARFPRLKGPAIALAALAAGVAGSYVATELLNEPAPAQGTAGAAGTVGDPASPNGAAGEPTGATA